MQQDIIDNVEKLNRASIDSAKRFGEINAKLVERLAERQLAFAADYLESGFEQFKRLGETKDFQAMVSGQTRYVTELNRKFVDLAKHTAEVLADARGEYAQWVEQGLKAAGAATEPGVAKSSTSAASKKAA